MKTELLYSIIVPTYNRAETISDTIQSVLCQAYPHFELIVVDDGSTDNTEDVVKSFNDERIFYFKKQNAERGAARNYGTEQSKGEYLTFLDSDDIVYPQLLEFANETIANFSLPPFFHMGFEIKNSQHKIVGKKHVLVKENTFSITKGNYISCIGVFVRRDVALKFKFSEDRRLSGSEDWELWLRIVANYGVKSDPRAVACFTQHDDRSVLNAGEEKLLFRKNLSFQYAFNDPQVNELFSGRKKIMESYFDLYISLHLALAKQNKRSFFYLKNVFFNSPVLIFNRRFYAVVKHLLKNIFN